MKYFQCALFPVVFVPDQHETAFDRPATPQGDAAKSTLVYQETELVQKTARQGMVEVDYRSQHVQIRSMMTGNYIISQNTNLHE